MNLTFGETSTDPLGQPYPRQLRRPGRRDIDKVPGSVVKLSPRG